MEDSIQVTVTVDVKKRTDITTGKAVEHRSQYTFTNVVTESELNDILIACTPSA